MVNRVTIKKHLINVLGNRLKQKCLVFESDDWGSMRIPTVAAREALLQRNLIQKSGPFSQFDVIEAADDYMSLYEILTKYKDCEGQYPVITTHFILNNPDFDKIAASNFSTYYDESFLQTYHANSDGKKTWDLVQDGINKKLIKPQFHGSEHLNVVRWMHYLKDKHEGFPFAFKNKCFTIDDRNVKNRRSNLMATYDYDNEQKFMFVKERILKVSYNLKKYSASNLKQLLLLVTFGTPK